MRIIARAPKSVLIVGAAGGVGTALVQLAKLAGWTVIGTISSKEKADFARGNGADHVINYRQEDVIARTRELTDGQGVGLVLDHVCGPEFTSYLGVLGRWGTLVSYNAFAGLPEKICLARCADISMSARPSAASRSTSTIMTARAAAR